MARKSIIERNSKRKKMSNSSRIKRQALKQAIYNKKLSLEERYQNILKLASLPRDSAFSRVRNRCELTGRGRGYYRKFMLSRNMLRELASQGLIPGLTKASW